MTDKDLVSRAAVLAAIQGQTYTSIIGGEIMDLKGLRKAIRALPAQPAEEVERLREAKDGAYEERNHLVAAFARLFPSGVAKTDILGWDPEWHGCCYIDLPSGQISYHFHDSQAYLFEGLPAYGKAWDGHDKDEVHARLARAALQQEQANDPD